jgi:hypothetical protein
VNPRVKEAIGYTVLGTIAFGLFVLVFWAARLL